MTPVAQSKNSSRFIHAPLIVITNRKQPAEQNNTTSEDTQQAQLLTWQDWLVCTGYALHKTTGLNLHEQSL